MKATDAAFNLCVYMFAPARRKARGAPPDVGSQVTVDGIRVGNRVVVADRAIGRLTNPVEPADSAEKALSRHIVTER